jgi:hypothetical protein
MATICVRIYRVIIPDRNLEIVEKTVSAKYCELAMNEWMNEWMDNGQAALAIPLCSINCEFGMLSYGQVENQKISPGENLLHADGEINRNIL